MAGEERNNGAEFPTNRWRGQEVGGEVPKQTLPSSPGPPLACMMKTDMMGPSQWPLSFLHLG